MVGERDARVEEAAIEIILPSVFRDADLELEDPFVAVQFVAVTFTRTELVQG